jgi:arylsulfatase A-like enzyme
MTVMDIAPTVLDLLGVSGDFGFDGRSLPRKA